MESRQTASKSISAAPVVAKAVNIRKYPDIQMNDGKRFSGLIKNAVACADSNERSELRGAPSLIGLS
jgi:hypothetical protein